MWKRAQHYLSVMADFLQIGGFLGLTLAILSTLLTSILGWMAQVPVFYFLVASVVVFAGVLYLARQLILRIGTISLAEGARIAYEQLRGTLWATAAERLRVDSTPEGILNYLATGLTIEIPVFGKYPPSTRLERIKTSDLKSGSIEGGATVLQLTDHHHTQITDLTVRKKDIRKAICHMKVSPKAFS